VEDERPLDDPARLADEAREQVEKNAVTLRAKDVPQRVEPPTPFVP